MLGITKLEEKIAETKDPVVQKKLQELLDERKKQWRQIVIFVTVIIIIWFIGHIGREAIKLYFDTQRTQMEIENIQLQREMLNR